MAELTKDAIDAVLAEHVEELDETECPLGTCSCGLRLPSSNDRSEDPFRQHLRDALWELIDDSTYLEWGVRTRRGTIVEADSEEWARARPYSSPYYAGATVVANRMTGWEEAPHG